ncbi:MAG: polyprenyl synthetase family protein [Acidobacteriota bacterium]
MRVEESLTVKKSLIEKELERILSGDDSLLFEAMRYAVLLGGKRFRPLLLLSVGECFGLGPKLLLPFACGLELIHNYSLIHDDLPAMDNDDYRRGRPTCHKRFGEDIAILAGDSLLTLAFELLAGAPVPTGFASRKQEAIQSVSRSAGPAGLIGGQYLDITLDAKKITEAKYAELILKKTGALIIAAVEIGAILGGARPAERRALADYGKNIGLAFQVRDDILDSRGAAGKKNRERPDFVAFVGMTKAKRRLETLVDKAVASLERFSSRGEELRCLAFSLLNLKPEAPHA